MPSLPLHYTKMVSSSFFFSLALILLQTSLALPMDGHSNDFHQGVSGSKTHVHYGESSTDLAPLPPELYIYDGAGHAPYYHAHVFDTSNVGYSAYNHPFPMQRTVDGQRYTHFPSQSQLFDNIPLYESTSQHYPYLNTMPMTAITDVNESFTQAGPEVHSKGHQSGGPEISSKGSTSGGGKDNETQWHDGLLPELGEAVQVILANVGGVRDAARRALKKKGNKDVLHDLLSNDSAKVNKALSIIGYRQKSESLKKKYLGKHAEAIARRISVEVGVGKPHASRVLNTYLSKEIADKLLDKKTFHEGVEMLRLWTS